MSTLAEIVDTDIIAYWDAGDLSAGSVSSWTDQINSLSLAQATAADQPECVANYNSSGFNAVDFDGTEFLSVDSATLDLAPGFVAIIAVADRAGTSPSTICSWDSGSSYIRIRDDNGITYRFQDAGGLGITTALSSSNSTDVVACRYQSGRLLIANLDSTGNIENTITATNTGTPFHSSEFFVGTRDAGLASQRFDGALYGLVIAKATTPQWRITAAATKLRDMYGVNDYDPEPSLPSGGGSGKKALMAGSCIG